MEKRFKEKKNLMLQCQYLFMFNYTFVKHSYFFYKTIQSNVFLTYFVKMIC